MWPIRELITNAILHRSYIHSSCVQVCLYDDRLEISSPGGLKRGLTLEKALAGRSETRNHALAQAFFYMKLIENWGTGLKRARDQIVGFGLREPEFLVDDEGFRVNIYRMSLADFGEKLQPTPTGVEQQKADGQPMETDANRWKTDGKPMETDGEPIVSREKAIVALLDERQTITTSDVASLLGLGMDRSKAIVRDLVARGVLAKHGNGRYTHYTLAGID